MNDDVLVHIQQFEEALRSSQKIERWDEQEILRCLSEIKVSLRNGGNPKYSVQMLLDYSKEVPTISGLASKITDSLLK